MKKSNGELISSRMGKILYGGLFILVLPVLLVFWAWRLDEFIIWPVPEVFWLALMLGFLGAALILFGMLGIMLRGEGLPMNAYPPKKLVRTGVYALFSHPIYLGAVFLSVAMSLLFQSSSGLYLISPLMALMLTALVLGYERGLMQRLFGDELKDYHPLFAFPVFEEKATTWLKRIAMVLRIYAPFLLLIYFIDYARGFGLSLGSGWTNFLYLAPFIYLFVRLLLATTAAQLFRNVLISTLASGLFLYFYLLLPLWGSIFRSPIWLLLTSLLITAFAMNYQVVWSVLRLLCEKIANSRHDYLFMDGRFRIMNHSLYAGLGGAVGFAIVTFITGNAFASFLALLLCLLGAAVFAQLRWGSQALLRPFGYWGAVLGAIVAAVIISFLFNISFSSFALALVLCAPVVQAIGRLRCLAQGCCHGLVTEPNQGIRVWQPQSRVCALSGLRGQWIQITQLYSILFNLLLSLVLWTMWHLQLPSAMIIAAYLVLTGTERFAEDAYRGETQTKIIYGLKEPQWFALIALCLGFVIALLPLGQASPALGQFDFGFFLSVFLAGLVTAFAMGMDFPKSNRRFSRLSG